MQRVDIAKHETEVILDRHHLTDNDARCLVALIGEGHVTKLMLGKNELGDDAAVALASCLETNRTLVCLGLASNHIGDRGAMALAKMLVGNTALRSLFMFDNLITTPAVQALETANAARSEPMCGLTGLII